ncbi:MFS transporter [Nonomuraea sp. 3N208]|uniref:MFS transporter n=1 Tax=Nonomuraea sp. 3N208 TaxID=3457421 RepID=UPI003FD17779
MTAAAVFAVLAILQGLCLPSRPRAAAGTDRPVSGDWREAFGDRAFISFAAAMIASYALSFQMYLALPLQVQRVGGGEAGVMSLYVTPALLGIAGQVRLTAWCARRWSRGQAISRGLALMGIAFLPPAAAAHLLLPTLWAILPVIACTILLTTGMLIAFPFEMATIADMAGNRLIGTYYGMYNLLSGIGILAGNLLAGAMVDLSHIWDLASLPWLVMAVAGLASAAAVGRLDRRGRLVPALSGQRCPSSDQST